MADSETVVVSELCTVYNISACFGGSDAPEEENVEGGLSLTPLVAAIWYGFVFSAQALGPFIFYTSSRQSAVDSLTRNTLYKNTWILIRFGNLILYAPLTLLWPFSFFASPVISGLYLKVEKFVSGLATLLHLIVLVMFFYSARMYLYESQLEYRTVEVEAVSYFFLTFVLIRMIGWSLKRPFL